MWVRSLVWLNVIGDTSIVLAYYSIPFTLGYFVKKRTDLAYGWMFVLFGLFIFFCGTTHLMSIWTIWHPDYVLEGVLKLITGLISGVAAFLLWPLIPKLLALPSPKALETSETFIRAIFNATPDAMLISNEHGIITMVNLQAVRLFGYKADELTGKSIDILVPEGIRAGHPALRASYMSSPFTRGMGMGRVVTALKADQTEFVADISLSPILTEQGRFYASTVRDITEQKKIETALIASEERFRRMADVSPAMIWITDSSGDPSFVNKTWLDFIGKDINAIKTSADWLNLIHPEDRMQVFDEYYHNLYDHRPIVTEYRLCNKLGEWRWILDQGVPMHDATGLFTGYIGSAIDITERKQAETDFRIAATAFESQEAMVITDANTVILRANKTFLDSMGYTVAEIVGQKMNLLQSGRHDHEFYQHMWETINSAGSWQGEIWDKRKNGEIFPKWLNITAVKDEADLVTHYVGTHIDISERKAAEDEIKNLAFYDPLTKLPNRRLLSDRLQQILMLNMRTGHFGALLFLDVDNFKILNDTLGHDKGDLLLQQVAKRLSNSVRECDTVARLGGDEFVIILDFLSDNATEAAILTESIGEKVLTAFAQPYPLNGFEYHCTPSIGVTLFNENDKSIDDLLKQADIAMYQAKAAGRNTLRFFDPSMQASITARVSLESDLHRALKDHQFQLHYQAQVDASGTLMGVEALIRWLHPSRGLVMPKDFLALAEETGLILPLGDWILETACAQLAAWATRPETAELSISVNVSIRQFRHKKFVEKVINTINKWGIKPEKLHLELTESLLATDVEDIIDKMLSLHEFGLQFSLDDFGTGYSSLFYLKKLPLSQLKIDQSFVLDILHDNNDATIANMIIALAKSMDLDVIAEGVENSAQQAFLEAHGCHQYQGYLYGKPLPITELELILNAKK
jgi:diguanylate cyclase (GGDEF)-like protein/PAS domain S-box-containing protein